MTVTGQRWDVAQESELSYWKAIDMPELLRICAEKPRFLASLGDALADELLRGKEILEIGCGPFGLSLVSFTGRKATAKRLVKTDPLPFLPLDESPLEREAWARPLLRWLSTLAAEGEYIRQAGEDLDFENCFDTVLCYNVLDHVRDPETILRNASRALRPSGLLIVAVYCFSSLGRLKFEWLARRLNQGSVAVEAHPHTFVPATLERMIESCGFQIERVVGKPQRLALLAGHAFLCGFAARKA